MGATLLRKHIKDHNVVGIDLGTTNSVISIFRDGNPFVINNESNKNTTPSIVKLGKDEIIGEEAKKYLLLDPKNTIFGSKRLIGRKYDDPEIQDYLLHLPYDTKPVCNGDIWIKTKIGKFSPSQIGAKILAKMKSIGESYLKSPVKRAVVTVPAYFNDRQRQATKNAGRIAGLDVIRIINEPTAAALAYGLDKNAKGHVAVYDLGGGTFDISILELGDGIFHVKSTNGDTFLGGEDFDTEFSHFLSRMFEQQEEVSLNQDKLVIQRLRQAAETAKKELSEKQSTKVFIENLIPGHDLDLTVTRDQLESVVKKVAQRTIEPCEKAIKDAKIDKSEIKHVILVGGMTRMPLIRKLVEEIFGVPPSFDIDPDEAVAKGAAIQAGILSGNVDNVLLLDVAPLSLGIEVLGGVFSKIVERNTTIPFKQTETFSTSEDNQEEVDIKIYQGERPMVIDNMFLGSIKLKNIPKAPRGVPKIDVTFEADSNGIIKVSAQDSLTKEKQAIEIIPSSGLTEAQIEKIIKKAELEKKDDKKKKESANFRTETLRYIKELERINLPADLSANLREFKNFVSKSIFDISKAKSMLDSIKKRF